MPRQINRLSARTVQTLLKPGRHADGNGLYLRITNDGRRAWVYTFRWKGKLTDKGLGSVSSVSLAEARKKAADARKLVGLGIKPTGDSRQRPRKESDGVRTFSACAEAYITEMTPGWRNVKHGRQWRSTLKAYAYPVIGEMAVDAIDTESVLKILRPIWNTKTETASRVRGRIEAILAWASAQKFRSRENPAEWRNHLENILPAPKKIAKVKHHAALPYAEISAFISTLRDREGLGAAALEFAILTAGRTNEVIAAKWTEFDLDKKVWTVPADRMKAGVEHRVPLSDRCIEILEALPKVSDYVFPGADPTKPLSNMTLLAVLERMDQGNLTTHGFRSTFRDWAAELTEYPNEVVEMALAHTVKNKAEAAYRRGDMLERRRGLMEDWAKYMTPRSETSA
jgi:integrase